MDDERVLNNILIIQWWSALTSETTDLWRKY